MSLIRPVLTLPLLAVLGLSAACAPTIIGAGATAGVAASEERGLEGAFDDTKIRAEINHLWFQRDVEMYRMVGLTITEGRVLLTGVVPTANARIEAVRLTWQADGVREVINEIKVDAAGQGLLDAGNDLLIQQKLKLKLLGDSEIRNINYTVDVVDRVIYLMGIAQSEAELERVIAHARTISDVRRVINHVRLKSDPRRIQG